MDPTPGQLSEAVAVPIVPLLTTVPQVTAPGPVKAVTLAGGVTTGAVLSTTVTVCVAVAVLPAQSVAVHVTVVLPTGKVFPEGVRDTVTPAQLSEAEAVPGFTTVSQDVAPGPVLALTLAGAVIVGGVLSVTVIVCTALAVFP
jgi:hypothetical protein